MAAHLNIFRILGDCTHVASKLILMRALFANKSAEGVSLITQGLYAVVFVNRYLDLLWHSPANDWYNFTFKMFYIASSLLVVFLMLKVYPRTREREKAWKMGSFALAGSSVFAPIVTAIFDKKLRFSGMMWNFSEILESVCILPQLLLLRQTDIPTVIDSYYLLALGMYRVFYILNWIVRFASQRFFDPVAVIFGVVQVAFYLDFAWVYYGRQRVKLRSGNVVVDADDVSRGWLLNKVFGWASKRPGTAGIDDELEDDDDRLTPDEEQAVRPGANKWGSRGISVSADEDVLPRSQDPHKVHHDQDGL